jgi:hypothetical protein
MDKKTAISKIRKCLALSRSANENEAATALRMAQAMMAQFNVEDADILAAEVSEARAKCNALKTVSRWENNLACLVSGAFGCKVIHTRYTHSAYWAFIGGGAAPDIAQYAFSVLLRLIKKERALYIANNCSRLKKSSKSRRGDLFCDGWIVGVSDKVRIFAKTPETESAINAFLKINHPCMVADPKKLDLKDRNKGVEMKKHDFIAMNSGLISGKNVELNHGIHEPQKQDLLSHI